MIRKGLLSACLSLSLLAAAPASAGERFVDDRLDDAASRLSAAAQELALAQNRFQQAGDWDNAMEAAWVLSLVNYSLGQLALGEDSLNALSIPSSLVLSVEMQSSLANYYATRDVNWLTSYQDYVGGEHTAPPENTPETVATQMDTFNEAMDETYSEPNDEPC